MTPKERLHALVEDLPEEQSDAAALVLEYLRKIAGEPLGGDVIAELRQFVEILDQEGLAEALDYLRWCVEEGESLSEGEIDRARAGKERIDRGEFVRLQDL